MKNGTMFPGIQNMIDSVRPVSQKLGQVCAIFAIGLYERLDTIAENTGDKVTRYRRIEPLIYTAAGTKTLEVPVGQTWTLKLLAVSGAPVTITVQSGGRMILIKVFATSDSFGPDVQITRGPGSAVEVSANGACEVTLHIDVAQRDDSLPGVSGDRHPPGIHTNAMELAIRQHFPGTLEGGAPYDDTGRIE